MPRKLFGKLNVMGRSRYRVADDRVLVLAVFDGRRDIEEVLLERLVRGS